MSVLGGHDPDIESTNSNRSKERRGVRIRGVSVL